MMNINVEGYLELVLWKQLYLPMIHDSLTDKQTHAIKFDTINIAVEIYCIDICWLSSCSSYFVFFYF